MEPNTRIAAIASRQHGTFSTAQAHDAGFSQREIDRRVCSGIWIRVHRGVYAISGTPDTPQRQAMAAALAYGNSAYTSYGTAGALWDLVDRQTTALHITLPRGQHRANRDGIVVHEADLTRVDRQKRLDIPVTGPHRTLVDLASMLAPADLESAYDDAVQARLVSVDSLTRYVELRHLGNNRGGRTLRDLLAERTKGRQQKELERMFTRKLRGTDLPAPARQYPVGRYFLDFAYPAARIAIELDGGGHLKASAYRHDRRRDNELALLGWLPLHFTWIDVKDGWGAVEDTLRQGLEGRTCVG